MGLRREFRKLINNLALKKKIHLYNKNDNIFDDTYKQELVNAKKWINGVNQELKNNIFINKNSLDEINLVQNNTIPQLLWCIKLSDKKTVINYGSGVHVHKNGIVEGVWDADFEMLGYANAKHVFGSGITLSNAKIELTPPSHMYECIYCAHGVKKQITYLSNSLSYILSLLDIHNIYDAVEDIRQNNDGLTKSGVLNFNPLLFTNEDIAIYGFYYHNIIISQDGISLALRENVTKFSNYSDYYNYLLEVMQKLINNGNAYQRKITYSPLSSISKGYDSPAVSSLLKKLGDFETVTINVDIYGVNDSGANIADKLEMKCYECKHPLGDSINNLGEIEYPVDSIKYLDEFIATVGLGDDLVFLSFDKYLSSKMVFSGALGDTIWDSGNNLPPFGIPVRVPFGKSLNEYRLRKGFIHIPLPVIGSVFPSYIYKINFLKDMNKFHVKSNYNRPIPRRIVEDSGVSRGTFANSKNATNPKPVNLQKFKKQAFENQMKKYSFIE